MNMPVISTTLADDLDHFLDYCRARRFSDHTCESYRSNNKRFIKWLQDCRKVARAEQIIAEHIHGY